MRWLKAALAAWRKPVSLKTCALLRIGLALAACNELRILAASWPWFAGDGPGRPEIVFQAFSLERERICLFYHCSASSLWTLGWIAALAYGFGLLTPVSGWLLWLVLVSIRNRTGWCYLDGGVQVLPAALLWANFLPSGRLWSIDRLIWPKASAPWTDSWPIRLIQLQISLIYLQSGYYKLLGHQWVSGQVVGTLLLNPYWANFDLRGLETSLLYVWFGRAATWSTLIWEITFPIGVFFSKTRRLYLAAGLLFHLGLGLTLEIGTFPLNMMILYLAFYQPRENPPDTPRARLTPLLAGGLFLLFCAFPNKRLLPEGSPMASNIPGLAGLDAGLVKVGQTLHASAPGWALWRLARVVGLDHHFTTFAPVVATFLTGYQLVECSPDQPARLIWSGLSNDPLGFGSEAPFQTRMVGYFAEGDSERAVYTFMESFRHGLKLAPGHWLELREFWAKLPIEGSFRQALLPGRSWLLGHPLEDGENFRKFPQANQPPLFD